MKIILLLTILLISKLTSSQELKTFKIQIEEDRIDAPVSVSLDGLNYNTDKGSLALYEVTANGEKQIPCQLESGYSAKLWFILEGVSPKNSTRNFILKTEEETQKLNPKVTVSKKHKDLSLLMNEKPVLSYRFETTFPPEGVNPLFKRSGFIHPLWSPGGEELSRIQPPDHYHHYGIWGPWTLTHIGER